MARKPIKKSIRFEVLNRDRYTCQYCGKKPPDVVLHVDHVHPVYLGGEDELSNLVTSCADCNLGKGKRLFDFPIVPPHLQERLNDMVEERQQIELLIEWSEAHRKLEDERVKYLKSYVESKVKHRIVNRYCIDLAEMVEKFEVDEIVNAIDISAERHLEYEKGKLTHSSIARTLKNIPTICANRYEEREGSLTCHI
jgi:hypothetical protein